MKLIHHTVKDYENVIIMGDFNFDNPTEDKQNIEDRKFSFLIFR